MGKSNINSKSELKKRVDFQVSFLTAAITLISSLTIFAICYVITYRDTIQVLERRVDAINERINHELNMVTFQRIEEKKDVKSIAYEEARVMLNTLREITGAKYIFTAKENENGRLIYVVDGMHQTDPEFRSPGDLIEVELQDYVLAALDGVPVIPNIMRETTWGKFYWAFYPAVYGGEVVGVIGIAFDTTQEFNTYKMLLRLAPAICIICCLVGTYIAFHVFRRISNPNYKDVYNTDMLTGLKNRNSFEVDLNNINVSKQFAGRAVLSIDLNNLKKVNDNFGHSTGDYYIQGAADILSEYAIDGTVAYRTGGDEFTVLVENARKDQLELWIENLQRLMREYKIGNGEWNSMSIGYAMFDEKLDEDLVDTYKRADQDMYRDKQRQKATR